MKLVSYKQFNKKGIAGDFNIPVGSQCIAEYNVITYNGLPVCYMNSENSHNYFAYDEDGNGLERGELINAINLKLQENVTVSENNTVDSMGEERSVVISTADIMYQLLKTDALCCSFRQSKQSNRWEWNSNFYSANIDELQYIIAMLNNVDRCIV